MPDSIPVDPDMFDLDAPYRPCVVYTPAEMHDEDGTFQLAPIVGNDKDRMVAVKMDVGGSGKDWYVDVDYVGRLATDGDEYPLGDLISLAALITACKRQALELNAGGDIRDIANNGWAYFQHARELLNG